METSYNKYIDNVKQISKEQRRPHFQKDHLKATKKKNKEENNMALFELTEKDR